MPDSSQPAQPTPGTPTYTLPSGETFAIQPPRSAATPAQPPLRPMQPGQESLKDTAYSNFPAQLTDERRGEILQKLNTVRDSLRALENQLLNPPLADKH